MHSRLFYKICLFLLLSTLVGCSSGDSRLGVTGKIQFKGTPIKTGTIQFTADDKNNKSFAGAVITDGLYEVPAKNGLMPGTYTVRISAGDPKQKAEEDPLPGETGPMAKELIPPEYNANSNVKFEVKAGQKNEFNLDIPKK